MLELQEVSLEQPIMVAFCLLAKCMNPSDCVLVELGVPIKPEVK